MPNYRLDVVLFEREPGCWVGQCLQYDLGAQAATLPELVYQLERSIVGHILISIDNGEEPFEGLGSAPKEYWEKFEGKGYTLQVESSPFRLPRKAARASVPQPRFKVAA